jgi:hypothetical protein
MASSASPSSFSLALPFIFSLRPSGIFFSPAFSNEFSSFSRLASLLCSRSSFILLSVGLFLETVLLWFLSYPAKLKVKLVLIDSGLSFFFLGSSAGWVRVGSPQPSLACPPFPHPFWWQLQAHSSAILDIASLFHFFGCANATRMALPKCTVSLRMSTAVAASWTVLKRTNPKTAARPDRCEGM